MTIEHARARIVRKPWGSVDLGPWSAPDPDGAPVGEIWFQRPNPDTTAPALLLKLLFTSEPLSIQVHPGDAFARSIGLDHGKSEAWYILSAAPGAHVAVGLKHPVTVAELRAAVADGSIADLVQLRPVAPGDVVSVPAGTIHAVGAGLVLAEIQQSSDATFRLFDYGRQRDLHVDQAIAVADAGPAAAHATPRRLADARTLLVATPHFVLERIAIGPDSSWELDAGPETWMLVVEGDAQVGTVPIAMGGAMFLEAERARIAAGPDGMTALVAYHADKPAPGLLARPEGGLLRALPVAAAWSPTPGEARA
ncbi:mannose-6-phosphate isomerase [Allostella vacuolata]|nr:mannose-6-phosphate isomerase [Stella vacuolata]